MTALADDGWVPEPDLLAAEMAVMGVAIATTEDAEAVSDVLRAADIFKPAHQVIFAAVQRILGAGEPVSPTTVLSELTRAKDIGYVGGGNYLHDLLATGERWALESNARRVTADAVRRRLMQAAGRIAQLAAEPGFDPEWAADEARYLIEAVFEDVATAEPAKSGELFDEALSRIENPEQADGMIAPPWDDLRDLIPVLRPGQLITVGARPGVGKSMIAADITRHAGLRMHLPAILFTLEMSREEVTDRLIAAETSVPLSHIQSGDLDRDDWDRVAKARETFADGTFLVDDTPGIGLAHIRSRLRTMARRAPARLAVVDYLQLMKGAGETREREIAALASGLKAIAREFEIPVVLLAQLNRAPESRSDHRPTKSDLRESGAIENDSDVVILIHRPDMHDPDSNRPGQADLIVDKNRAGPMGTRAVLFQGHYGRFADLSRPWTPTSALGED
jgi:replicative DNA helicase